MRQCEVLKGLYAKLHHYVYTACTPQQTGAGTSSVSSGVAICFSWRLTSWILYIAPLTSRGVILPMRRRKEGKYTQVRPWRYCLLSASYQGDTEVAFLKDTTLESAFNALHLQPPRKAAVLALNCQIVIVLVMLKAHSCEQPPKVSSFLLYWTFSFINTLLFFSAASPWTLVALPQALVFTAAPLPNQLFTPVSLLRHVCINIKLRMWSLALLDKRCVLFSPRPLQGPSSANKISRGQIKMPPCLSIDSRRGGCRADISHGGRGMEGAWRMAMGRERRSAQMGSVF